MSKIEWKTSQYAEGLTLRAHEFWRPKNMSSRIYPDIRRYAGEAEYYVYSDQWVEDPIAGPFETFEDASVAFELLGLSDEYN